MGPWNLNKGQWNVIIGPWNENREPGMWLWGSVVLLWDRGM